MHHYTKHLINKNSSIREALQKLDELASDAILFLVDDSIKLLGSLTDGDLRRGFIKGLGFNDHLSKFIQHNPKYIQQGQYNIKEVIALRERFFSVIPVVNTHMQIMNVVNFRHQRSYLPIDAVVMAGGRGERLRPLTDNTPKPLLPVGDKPIIEHNVDRLRDYGVDDIWISVHYLGEKIENYFKDGSEKSLRINYIYEDSPLGTLGAVGCAEGLKHETVLVMNSDLLTNINFEDFYLFFEKQEAEFAVACIPYKVNVPYAVLETEENLVKGFKEKPSYTHYSNAGIYLMKRELVNMIPESSVYNATDLMEELIKQNKRVVAYPLMGYWLDIGKPDDYRKAQEDIKHIVFV